MSDTPGTPVPEVIPTAMVMAQSSETSAIAATDLTDLGFIVPLATPQRLRALFAEKQRLYAAILDESDYIYTVSYVENGKTRQNIYTRRDYAEKVATTYGVEIRATPKKSGIVKLASALGITAKRTMVKGLPEDPGATYSYVVYEAEHARSGRTEQGVGWCDRGERGGTISIHNVIATADTRAYNRAVLRLSGFGDVSADEIVSGGAHDDVPQASDVVAAPKKPLALPASTADDVLTAQRAWAEESAKRTAGFLAEAQQSSKAAREMRARARRGDVTAAAQMGSLGYLWQGSAQDSLAHETFEVEKPTVTVADIERVKTAAQKPGWDISGTGSVREENRSPDDLKPVTREQAAAGVPAPSVPRAGPTGSASFRDTGAETITGAQAKALSEKLLKKFGTKEKAQEFLRTHADVERSALVRQNQLAQLEALLAKED